MKEKMALHWTPQVLDAATATLKKAKRKKIEVSAQALDVGVGGHDCR